MTDRPKQAQESPEKQDAIRSQQRWDPKLGWFPHERMDVFHVAMEFALWVEAVRKHIPRAKLRNQLDDACDSIVLNICEGAGRSAGARRNHFETAYASTCECHGAVSLCRVRRVPRAEEGIALLHRLRRMLARLH
jgi:four helix bundle protein